MAATHVFPRSETHSEVVLASLERVSAHHGGDSLAARLAELRLWLSEDLASIEQALAEVGGGATLSERAGRHLLDQGGKRIRPICVALAARAGTGFGPAARSCAVAVELVHNATLLHDDVVDVGDTRRGAPTARVLYGNAASIFAGDWLLVEALFRIQAANLPGVLERGLEVIREMVFAEALQLERRNTAFALRRASPRVALDDYFRIVRGKTASLFRWAMFAGARAGGVSDAACDALERYGEDLGVAFQLVDDVLDVACEQEATGKTVLADLREGKLTYPLLVAMDRDAGLAPLLEQAADSDAASVDASAAREIAQRIGATGAVDACVAEATARCDAAARSLDVLPRGRAREALEAVARSMPARRR
jgi:octaprenyl-diphosphate synthase